MSLLRLTSPAIEPITLDELVVHLRVTEMDVESVPTPPDVALAGLGAGNVDNGDHRYRCTFVTADGETDGGEVSDKLTVVDRSINGQVRLTHVPLSTSTRVTARKLYRTKANRVDLFFYVGTLSNNTVAFFTDNVADAALGAGCPVHNTAGDPALAALIGAAREQAEDYMRKCFIRQKWRLLLDGFPDDRQIELMRVPLLRITDFEYQDYAGAWHVVDPAIYAVDVAANPGRIVLDWQSVWPIARPDFNTVKIEFEAGYGDLATDVPNNVRAGIKLLAADLYEHREITLLNSSASQLLPVKRCLADRFITL